MKIKARPYSDPKRPHLTHVVTFTAEGKRKRRFFENKTEAEAFARSLDRERRNIGTRAADTLSDKLKIEAGRQAERLKPWGKTITDAVTHYIGYLEATQKSVSIEDAAEEFLANARASGKSKRTLEDLKHRLRGFRILYGHEYAAAIGPRTVEDYLDGIEGAALTRNHSRRVLSGFFKYCERRGYCQENPLQRIPAVKVTAGEVEVYTPAEMAAMVTTASGDVLGYIAFGGFAGLRESEIQRLDWRQVKRTDRVIDLRGGKTPAARRLVTILPALERVLAAFADKTAGPVCEPGFIRRLKTFKAKLAAETDEHGKPKLAIQWRHNALRHSFASYHMAQHEDAAKTALQMGHSNSAVVFRHYRLSVTKEAATEWWAILE